MSTTVHTPGPNSSTEKSITRADGASIRINEGHLFLLNDSGTAIAVFAPGRWHRAEVNENKTA